MKNFKPFWILIFIFSMLSAGQYTSDHQLDINNASYKEVLQLPVPESLAKAIYERVTFRGPLKSIYDLRTVEGMDQKTFLKIKPLIRVEPFRQLTSAQEKMERIYFRLDRWSSDDGVNDAFVDLWIEKALEPINVNNARYDELVNLQNVSPIDAVAILKHRKNVHWIRDERDLRRVPGLTNYAYRSARYFLDYSDVESDARWHGYVSMRVDNTPFMATEGEQSQEAGLSAIQSDLSSGFNLLPNTYVRGRFTYRERYKFGFTYYRTLNEPGETYSIGGIHLPDMKFFFGMENQQLGPFNLRRLYVGNYSVTMGQGVVMETTDYFTPRKSGYGFRKRFQGIAGDISRTREYTLKGAAAELDYKDLSLLGFVSFDDRDAILNRGLYGDSLTRSFNQLIVLDQRFKFALGDSLRSPEYDNLSWLNTVKELTYGGRIQYTFLPGTFLGMSFYESAYDRPIDPDPYQIVGLDYRGDSHWDIRQVTTDSEIKQAYGGPVSSGSNPFWSAAKSFRRVIGIDFQTVIKNIAIQGELGELDKGAGGLFFGNNPKAFVISAFTQFSSFNILLLYRNYDLAFDNPYQRSFSNYRRYKGTMYEDYYYLQSVLYGQLYTNNPQPQAEEGLYIDSYYQLSRKLVTRLQYDNWQRKADAAKMYRLVGTIDYRPVYPLSIQLRNKWQSREETNSLSTTRFYKNYEFRGRVRMRLSGYDSFSLLYSVSKLINHPRPRVFQDIVLDGEAISANYIHNFNRYFKISGMLTYYNGFLWNFEDTQFVVMDSKKGALRYWISFYSRLSPNLTLRLKYTGEHHKPISGSWFSANNLTRNDNPEKRFETDWLRQSSNLFYFEINYNF